MFRSSRNPPRVYEETVTELRPIGFDDSAAWIEKQFSNGEWKSDFPTIITALMTKYCMRLRRRSLAQSVCLEVYPGVGYLAAGDVITDA